MSSSLTSWLVGEADPVVTTALTAFPPPGEPRTRPFKDLIVNDLSDDDELLEGDKAGYAPHERGGGGLGEERRPDDPRYTRDYWMPDRLCKTCYDLSLIHISEPTRPY